MTAPQQNGAVIADPKGTGKLGSRAKLWRAAREGALQVNYLDTDDQKKSKDLPLDRGANICS